MFLVQLGQDRGFDLPLFSDGVRSMVGPRRDARFNFRHHPIDRVPVDPGDGSDVFRTFQAPLNLERSDAEANEIRQNIEGGEILRTEQVAAMAEVNLLAVGEQFVGHAAGLRAFSAVGGAAAERFAGQTLAGIGHAERAVDKNFEGHGGRLRRLDRRDLFERVLPGEHDQTGSEFLGEGDAGRTRDRHLRRAVDGKIGREGADEPADAHVLNDGRIGTGGNDAAQIDLGLGEFVREGQRVERHVPAHAAAMEIRHELREVGDREVLGPHAGVEALQTEVNGVRTVLDRGLHAFPIAGRRQDLRAEQPRRWVG